MDEIEKNREKSIFWQLWEQLSLTQRRYAVARLSCGTKAEAAKSVGIEPGTAYGWPCEVERVVELLADDIVASTVEMLTQTLAKAAIVKIDGLSSSDERVKQAAATEIMDRVIGKATQKLEHTGKDGGPMETKDVRLTDAERRTAFIAMFGRPPEESAGPPADTRDEY